MVPRQGEKELSTKTDIYDMLGFHRSSSSEHTGYRFGFNGQEKVDEINGSSGSHNTALFWEYDTRIARRWNQDPRPNPSISNYAAFAGNPIMYSDALGDTVKIKHRKGFLGLGKEQSLNYQDGGLFNADGSAYEGKVNGFLKKAVNALNTNRSTKEGGSMLEELEGSENVVTIEKSGKNEFVPDDGYKAYADQWATDPSYAKALKAGTSFTGGSGGTIFWNPNGGTTVAEQGSGSGPSVFANRPSVFLGHEMFHALDGNRGKLDSRPHLGIQRSEWQAVYRENILRKQMGLPLRTHYKSEYNLNTGDSKPLPPYMLAPTRSPLLPSWYKP